MGEGGASARPNWLLRFAGLAVLLGAGAYALVPLQAPPPAPAVETAERAPAAIASAPEPEETTRAYEPIALPPPRIDEFRLEPDGVAVLAGRSVPGDTIYVLLDGAELTQAPTSSSGAFALVAFIDPSPDLRVLTLRAVGADGLAREAGEELIVAPMRNVSVASVSEPEDPLGSAAAPLEPASAPNVQSQMSEPQNSAQPAQDRVPTDSAVKARPSVQAAGEQPPTPQRDMAHVTEPARPSLRTPQVEDGPEAALTAQVTQIENAIEPPEATSADLPPTSPQVSKPAPSTPPNSFAVLRSTPDGIEVMQTPGSARAGPGPVALDAISYSAQGDVQLSGRAEQGASEVRIYLDNRVVAALPVQAGGDWRGDVPDIASGIYTLRIDSVSANGAVQSRVETPFKREDADVLVAALSDQARPFQAITVQSGATLWAIARTQYGDPLRYVQVFEANRDQIRDPDLIYPGQVLTLPETRSNRTD